MSEGGITDQTNETTGRGPGGHRGGKHTPPPERLPAPKVVLLKVPEASARYRLGEVRLRRLINDGQIPVVRLDRRILIRPEAIEAWLLRQEAKLDRGS